MSVGLGFIGKGREQIGPNGGGGSLESLGFQRAAAFAYIGFFVTASCRVLIFIIIIIINLISQ